MIRKKRHHYIPRFYLRRFSIDCERKFLQLYNLENGKFVEKASLKNQAYENFLYDEEIEEALAQMEDAVSKLFHFWTEEQVLCVPAPASNSLRLLKRFILYQIFRTPKSGSDYLHALSEGAKVILSELRPSLRNTLRGGSFLLENPVVYSLLSSAGRENLLDFLDFKFLVNLADIPFITSDSPVILYNQLMEKANNYVGATGLICKGLQVFFPIHPRLMICLFDPNVYDFGDGCVNCCGTESVFEVNQLNGLQLVNCDSQLFFNDEITQEYISDLMGCYGEYRGTSKNINRVFYQGNSKLFLSTSEAIRTGLKLDFFTLKINPDQFKTGLVPPRDPSLK